MREKLYSSLLGNSKNIEFISSLFRSDEKLGLVCPDQFLLQHTDFNMTYDHGVVKEICDIMDIKFQYSVFPAGSMFWFRPEALHDLTKIKASIFPPESGLADGTPAHAVERLFSTVAACAGFNTKTIPILPIKQHTVKNEIGTK